MKIPVLGMDPSLRHWGLSETILDLSDGTISTPIGSIIEPKDLEGKNIRVNSNDLHLAEQLANPVLAAAKKAKVIFVECPVGSQSARAMAAYGIQLGILGTIRSLGLPLIEVTALESKLRFCGNKNATKKEMIAKLIEYYPDVILPKGNKKGAVGDKAEHIADATAAIYSGVRTSSFQTIMRILQKA